jgi:CO/xanthine dehydrogenase Mo-binding subunit
VRARSTQRAFVTGAHAYASDISLPGMLHGKVLRPSGFRASLESLDADGRRGDERCARRA